MKLLVALIGLLVLSGCDVIAEIDAEIGFSEEELARSRPKQEEAAPEEAPVTAAQLEADWWGKAKTLGPREKQSGDDAMVRCRIGGGERFTRSRDCLSSGGSIL